MKHTLKFYFLCIFILATIVYGLEVNNNQSKIMEAKAGFLGGLTHGPHNMNMTWEKTSPVTDASQADQSIFFDPHEYTMVKGITTFRGNNYRNTAAFGQVQVNEAKLEIVWSNPIGYIDKWSGVGWNGQPAIIEWDYDYSKE